MILIDTNELRYWPALYESPELRDDASAHEDFWSRSLIAKLQRSQLKTLFLAWRATHLLFTWARESDGPVSTAVKAKVAPLVSC